MFQQVKLWRIWSPIKHELNLENFVLYISVNVYIIWPRLNDKIVHVSACIETSEMKNENSAAGPLVAAVDCFCNETTYKCIQRSIRCSVHGHSSQKNCVLSCKKFSQVSMETESEYFDKVPPGGVSQKAAFSVTRCKRTTKVFQHAAVVTVLKKKTTAWAQKSLPVNRFPPATHKCKLNLHYAKEKLWSGSKRHCSLLKAYLKMDWGKMKNWSLERWIRSEKAETLWHAD